MVGRVCSRGLIAIAVAAALASGGCKSRHSSRQHAHDRPRDAGRPEKPPPPDRQHERVVLRKLDVRMVPPSQPREIEQKAIADALWKQLLASHRFYAEGDPLPPGMVAHSADFRLSINYDVIPDGDQVSLLAAVVLEVMWESGDDLAPVARILAEHPIPKPARDADIDRAISDHIAATVAKAGQELIEEEGLRTGPADDIVAALGSSSVDTQLWALALVRDRRLAAAYDRVIALLDSSESDVRETAVGALIAIGDQRAVGVLADKVELSDYPFLRVVIEAASALGGEEAESFLEFVATGHPDREIRERATQALERLSRHDREPAGTSGP